MRRAPSALVAALLAALTLSACSPERLANASASLNGLRVTRDLPYGPDARNVLDLYAPAQARGAPIVLFIHGGSWKGGSKDGYTFVGESLARVGYLTAVMSYRLAPKNRYPSFIQDAAQALRWLQDHAAERGGDPKSLFVVGHSAGAFNALEVTVNPRWLSEAGVPISSVRGVVGIAGPYDYDFRAGDTRDAFPAGATPTEVMPSRHVRADPPPTLLLVAGKDQVVGPENGARMLAALQAKGADVTLTVLPGVDHYTVIGALGRNLQFLGGTRRAVLEFLGKASPKRP